MEALNFEEIAEWLCKYIGEKILLDPSEVTLEQSLEELAMDSMNVVRMAGELEDLLGGIEIESALIYEYKSLNDFCKQLAVMHANHLKRKADQGTPIEINICASFTSEPIEESLQYWLKMFPLAPKISFSPYNQIFQELINPASSLTKNPTSINVILFRIEDWFRFEKETVSKEKARETVEEFLQLLGQYSTQKSNQTLLVFCPHTNTSVRKLGLSEYLDKLDEEIFSYSKSLSNLHCLNFKSLSNDYSLRRIFDEARDQIGHIPFSPEYFSAMGMALARRIYSTLNDPYKVIVLDCDNTLWKGVCGEVGATNVEVTENFKHFQKFILQQKDQGKIICLCSKNNENDVWEVFEKNSDMLLSKDDIVLFKINWNRKSQNLIELADELQLGLDSFIFIDDNAAECEEVSQSIAEILTIQFPEAENLVAGYFKHHWAFDSLRLTDEDRQRSEMYKQNQQREKLRATVSSFQDFIDTLNVETKINKLETDDITRAAQLTHRTNQFNATTIRRSESDIAKIITSENREIYTVKVKDRFGDYGFVGLLIVQFDESQLTCETFLMSCRVLAKQVEQTMVRYLSKVAIEKNLESISLRFRKSEKNKPVHDFFKSLGKSFITVDCEFDEIKFTPEEAETILKNSIVEHQVESKTSDPPIIQSDKNLVTKSKKVLDEIAKIQGDVNSVIHEIRVGTKLKRGNLETKYIAPRTAWHKKIASIWCDILGIDKVGIYDSFFELGGDSLRAAEAFARMWELGIPDSISLINIPEPTVAMLCQAIEDVKAGRKPQLVTDQFSLEDEGSVAEDIRNEGYDVKTYDIPMKNVFLTGATGYLGAFILSELFLQTDVKVNCLVRAATETEARERIQKNLSRYKIWNDNFHDRLDITLGELTEPWLGMSEKAFTELANNIDTIFHSGAWVNFVFPYQRLKAAHVDAIETMMRLAVTAKPKPIAFHFISTLGVIMSTGYGLDDVVLEDNRLEHVEGLLNGYEQAKHVADKMAYIGLKERGIPTAIYRPGMVGGIGSTGEYHKVDEFLSSYYKGCIQLGSWPLLNTTWEVVPVDFLTKVIVHSAKDPKNLNQAYFTLHPEPTMVEDYIKWFQDFGYPMRALPWDVWKRELISQGAEKLRNNSLFPYVDFIRALEEDQVRFPTSDRSNFQKLVDASGVTVPSQLEVLERYMRYFITTGFISAPMN